MSIASEIEKLSNNLTDSYDACKTKDATIPENENFDNLPNTIFTIPQDFYATVYVYSEEGATITYLSRTYTVGSSGYVTISVRKYGTATFTASLSGHSQTGSVYVYSASYYSVNIPLKSYIKVYAPVSTVVTIGSESQTITDEYVTFTEWETGTYTISAVYGSLSKTDTVTITELGQTVTKTIAFGQNVIIYTNNGTEIIDSDGKRQTVTTGSITYWTESTGTYKYLLLYRGQAKDIIVNVETTGVDVSTEEYFVPLEYQQVEYIKSPDGVYGNTGAYIDTGYKPNANTVCEIKFQVDAMNDSVHHTIAGVRRTGEWKTLYTDAFGFWANSSNLAFNYRNVDTGNIYSYSLGTIITAKLGNKSVYINGSSTYMFSDYNTTSNYNLYLFALNQEGTVDRYIFNTRIYYTKIIENGVLSCYFIPCYRKSDSVAGMYDVITDTFYTNQGTGTFSVGSDVGYTLPSTYQEVEYLQLDGSQYIDTGLTNVNRMDYKYETEITVSDFSNTLGMFGCRIPPGTEGNTMAVFFIPSSSYATNALRLDWAIGLGQAYTGSLTLNQKHKVLVTGNYAEFDNNHYTYTASQVSNTIPYSIYIGNMNNGGTAFSTGHKGKIYYVKIYNSGTLVRDMIPCYRKSDSVAGMYDLVNDVFYTNSGSGSFTTGSEVGNYSLPTTYQLVKYIASTSDKTQYLNLNTIGTDTTGILIKAYDEYDFSSTGIVKDNVYIGGRSVSNGRMFIGGTKRYATEYSRWIDYSYMGWNTLYRLTNVMEGVWTEDISITKTLRSLAMNFRNTRKLAFDNTYVTTFDQTLVQDTPNLYAFTANNMGSAAYNSWARMYYVILTSGTLLSKIFIPCYRKSDNVIGMYDVIGGTFFTNAGSGNFIKKNLLPSEYQEVEYIQSSGTQYIDTGVNTDSSLGIETEFQLPTVATSQRFGVIQSIDGSYNRHHFDTGSSTITYHFRALEAGESPYVSIDTNKHYLNIDTQNQTGTIDSNMVSLVSGTFDTQLNYWLFRRNSNLSSLMTYGTLRYYYVILKDNTGNKLRDFVPCYRKSDNVAGMYDLVNMQFYTNAGSGTFTVGSDVN